MRALSLRLRIFLFFCLMALGGAALMAAGLFLGYRQLDVPDALSAFVTAGVVGGLGLLGLTVAVWLLFDENVAKPIEALAAGARVRAHGAVSEKIDAGAARHLGDLAPAVAAIHARLTEAARASEDTVRARTARLEGQRAQLLQILSDIPVAVIVAGPDHRIVLYDGQAADLMERECPARLGGSVFDYLDEATIRRALAALENRDLHRTEIAVTGRSGAIYKGHIRRFGTSAGYTLMLEPLAPDAARPLVYDFDLLDRPLPQALEDCPLQDLTFAVFDSETTGLDPDRDAVVQLGAVRVMRGRIVPGEVFNRLVNPGRPIPPGSTKVHGVSDAMVADAPEFGPVCRAFHGFAQGDVLVAHNAPFDMAFLRREARREGFAFDSPVLDTVHLSAIVFGGSAEHTLDALCLRLGVEIPEADRHTALGDAQATALALAAMLPILEARGLRSFADVRAEARRHSRILALEN